MAARLSDDYLAGWYEKISNGTEADESPEGRAPGVMPAMKDALTREQIWLAVTYLTSDERPGKEVSR
jgi:mono/diheme cytochrome c family protein